jgi:hypothetical protein
VDLQPPILPWANLCYNKFMGYGPIPNQRMISATGVTLSNGKYVTLPAGAFIKVINKDYVPKYHPFEDYNQAQHVVAYTQFGMALVPLGSYDKNVY